MIEEYLKEKLYLKNVSKATVKSYRQAYDRFTKYGGAEINKASLNAFVVGMREAGLSPVTCNISIRSMNSYLTWLYENGYTTEHFKVKQLKTEKKVIKAYEDAELKKILSFKPKTLAQHRLYAIVCTLIECGCRIDEILGLKRSDLDMDNLLFTVCGKGNKQRVVPFSFDLRKVLFKYLTKHKSEYVFASRYGDKPDYRTLLKQWTLLCKSQGVEYRGFHSLRHNFSLNFIREGGDVFTLQRLLGHTSIQTTQIYVTLQTEDLQKAHKKTSILGRLK